MAARQNLRKRMNRLHKRVAAMDILDPARVPLIMEWARLDARRAKPKVK